MIQASELRIGNWISHNGRCLKVKGVIPVEVFGTQVLTEKNDSYIDIEDIEAIPLTTEILETCNMGNSERIKVQLTLMGEKDVNDGKIVETYVQWKNIDVKYLHQLQNLVYFSNGKELEIKL